MSACAGCGTALTAGALLCPVCQLPVAVSPLPVVGSTPRSAQASALAPVESGIADKRAGFELPSGDFRWTLGRHDLVSRPPTVVDVDLSTLCRPVELADGSRGFAVSRQHAVLARLNGALTLTAHAAGTTFARRSGDADFTPLEAGIARVVEVGTRLVFGTHRPLILEVV